jgi:uncharacterized membrane protein YgcG
MELAAIVAIAVLIPMTLVAAIVLLRRFRRAAKAASGDGDTMTEGEQNARSGLRGAWRKDDGESQFDSSHGDGGGSGGGGGGD